jgi:predicted enzyme related to lactoylglutathione lyase
MAGFAELAVVDLACADPSALAEFYHQVLGWDVTHVEEAYTVISDGSTRILFSRVNGYQGPGWPDTGAPKRYHLCLRAADMAKAAERCLELGARRPEYQPGGGRWTVLIDPAGHPFCLAQAQ